MNNFDEFLNYLDKRMNKTERVNFEKKLEENKNFRSEFERFLLIHSTIKSPVKVDEDYFEKLIVKTKSGINKQRNHLITNVKVAYVLPLILIGSFFIYQLVTSDNNSKYNFNELYSSFVEDDSIAMNLVEEAVKSDEFYFYENIYPKEIYSNVINPDISMFDYVEKNLNLSDINYDFFEELSEDEFNNIYNELLNRL